MAMIFAGSPRGAAAFFLILSGIVAAVRASGPQTEPNSIWDSARYIGIEEVKPGMEAYCLTVYKGAQVERFELEVLSVVRDYSPGRDAILVQGKDERFIHTGPVAGCSGSPVYIEGRLAGAMAFGWFFSKDPLYGVTPIREMLEVGRGAEGGGIRDGIKQAGWRYPFDYSKPIDFAEVEKQIISTIAASRGDFGAATPLPCPLVTSGLPARVVSEVEEWAGALGLMAVSGPSGGATGSSTEPVQLVPGACLAVPLVNGDITMEVIGTVTEVRGNDVYGFGHSFLGYGAVHLPMATGQVHTVVSSVMRSFKVATSLDVVGVLNTDESAAVRGRLGEQVYMIPLTVEVERYNDPRKRRYDCRIVDNRIITPLVLRAAVMGAVLMQGGLPPDNTLDYKVRLDIDGAEPILFENVSTDTGLTEMIRGSSSSLALLMSNPYREVRIKSIDIAVKLLPKNISSIIQSATLADSQVKAGEPLHIDVVVETYLAEKMKYSFDLAVPRDVPPGRYELMVCGGYDYEEFLRRAVPQRFTAVDLPTLVESMNEVLGISRDGLHCVLVLPPSGIAVERAELPDLPSTKAMVLGDAKRAMTVQPCQRWVEKSMKTGTVVLDGKMLQVSVTE